MVSQHHELQGWTMLTLRTTLGVIIALLVMPPITGRAQEQPGFSADLELASITVAQDQEQTMKQKLGQPACAVTAPNNETTAYVYRNPEGSFLQVVVDTTRSDADYQRVESLTMSLAPIQNAACDTLLRPVRINAPQPLETGKGVHLGNSIEHLMQLYGEPAQKRVDDGLVHLQYAWDRELVHYYEWDLVFRDGRLVEWTVQAFPVFIEVGG